MSNWILLNTRGDKHRMLVRLDSVQFIRESYSGNGKASIAFEGDDELIGVEESFDDVVKAVANLWRNGERIH